MLQHFSMPERCTFFALTFTTASSIHNDLEPVMFASHRFSALGKTYSMTTTFLHGKKNFEGCMNYVLLRYLSTIFNNPKFSHG